MSFLDVDTGSVHDFFVRHIPRGGDPFYQPPEPADGRWQRGANVAAWYFADEPETAWDEWYRALAGTGLPPAQAIPRDLWRWRIDLDRVALLDDDARLARVGLPRPRPTQQQWPACQKVGDALHDEGYDALLVASAARPAHRNLVVFRFQYRPTGCATTATDPDRRCSSRAPRHAHLSPAASRSARGRCYAGASRHATSARAGQSSDS